MDVFKVVVGSRSQSPILISARIEKETPKLYKIDRNRDEPESWHWGNQVEKSSAHTTALAAWKAFETLTRAKLSRLKEELDIVRARLVHTERAIATCEPAPAVDAVGEALK